MYVISEPFLAIPKAEAQGNVTSIGWNWISLEVINPFSDQNSEVIGYSLIVWDENYASPEELMSRELISPIYTSWFDIRNDQISGPYNVFGMCGSDWNVLKTLYISSV